MDEQNDIVKRIREKHLSKDEPESKESRIQRFTQKLGPFVGRHKKAALATLLCLIVAGFVLYFFMLDFITKRQNYPERNVLFRATSVMDVAGTEGKKEKDVDRLCDTLIYEGGVVSKVGTYLLRTVREVREDIEYFNMDNMQKIRIASATRKSEVVQAGMRVGGSLNFKEQFAEIIVSQDSKAPQSYHVYKFVPERGLKEVEVTVVRHADGARTMENRMIEHRESGLGWLRGKRYRAGTSLEQYKKSPENEKLADMFHDHIESLDSMTTVDKSKREKIIGQAGDLSEQIKTEPISISHEDGFFDLLPQESTIYLGYKPGLVERVADAFIGKSDRIRLRVENQWDLFPGRYPVLRNLSIGKDENVVYPFDKYNNGGYTIQDKYGDIAKIEIEDFIWYYGQDLLYWYYLDMDGDGKIHREAELLGTVLLRTTHDERVGLEMIDEDRPPESAKFTIHYSFMAPDKEMEKGIEYFRLCGYIETMMPDQVNRGFGKHSMLGYINQQRSDIMLFRDLTIENMSRVLTEESTLVAKYDIVRLLIAAKRPYANAVADMFGVSKDFAGKYQTSDSLRERRDWSVIAWTGVFSVAFIAFMVRRLLRKRKSNRKASGSNS